MLRVRVGEFLPSTHGFRFSAQQLVSPPILLTMPGGSQLTLPEIVSTLAGGMAFLVADFYRAGVPIPRTTAPTPADPLYTGIVWRQFDNLDPGAIGRIMGAMHPQVPEYDRSAYRVGSTKSRARRLLLDEWPRIMHDLDVGYLAQLTIMDAVTSDARRLGEHNRQVLAYGYDVDDGRVLVRLYDPHYPRADDIVLTIPASDDPSKPLALHYSRPEVTPRGFFYAPYSFKSPV